MVGDEQQDGKADRVALPPPTKRRDHHLRMLFIVLFDENFIRLFSFN